jgi:hypothetical protein
VKGHAVNILETEVGENASMTTDLWTSPTNNSFISLTLHYLDADFQQKMVVLGCFPFDETHEASAIQEKINGTVEEYDYFRRFILWCGIMQLMRLLLSILLNLITLDAFYAFYS